MAPSHKPGNGNAAAVLDEAAVEALIEADELEKALELLGRSTPHEGGARILQEQLKQAKHDHFSDLLDQSHYNDTRSRLAYDMRRLLRGEAVEPQAPDSPDWAPLRDLAEKVEKNWIDAFYKRYLPDGYAIPIPLRVDFDAVDHAWPASNDHPDTPSFGTIIDVYEQMNGYVLILGPSGSGKTFALLQVADHLLRQLKTDHARPVPIVLDLSQWRRNTPVLADWIVENINKTYVVDKRQARTWLKDDRLVLLLDRFDQVSDHDRQACVQAINQFLGDFTPRGLVVCSHTGTLTGLHSKLQLWAAVHLEALNQQEIMAYFNSGSPELAKLGGIVQAGQSLGLMELCATPLGLSLLWDTYRAGDLAESRWTTDSLPQVRSQLFDRYIDRVLPQNPRSMPEFSRPETLRWLSWLAQYCSGIFRFEQMQPAWLPKSDWQHVYYFLSRMVFGVITGLLGGVIIGLGLGFTTENLWRGIIEGLAAGLVVGVVSWFTDTYWQQRLQRMPRKWLRSVLRIALLILGSVVGVVVLFLLVLMNLEVLTILVPQFRSWGVQSWVEEALMVGTLTGLSVGLVFGIEPKEGPRDSANDIQTGSVERLQLSYQRAWHFGPYGLVFGAAAGLAAALTDITDEFVVGWVFVNPLMEWAWRRWTGVQAVAAVTILVAVICGLAAASIGGLTGSAIVYKSRSKPNEAIQLSLKNAIIIGGTMAVMWSLIGWALDNFVLQPPGSEVSYTLALYGLFIGYLAFLWFGGLNVYLHFVLRLMLRRLNLTPPVSKYEALLDHCTELRFMSAVLGGYIFRHTLWQEHFATKFRQ